MRVLMMLIGEVQTPAAPVVYFERFLEPYFLMLDAGIEVVLVSPQGGDLAIRTYDGHRTDASRLMTRLGQDQVACDAIADTLELTDVNAEDFDGAFCLGVTGRVWSPNSNNLAGDLIGCLLVAGKPVAVVPFQLDLVPRGTAEGILIGGDRTLAPRLVALALIGALKGMSEVNT